MALNNKIIGKHATSMAYIDAQENLKSGDVMGLWVDESERADQSSPAQQKTSLESIGGHANSGGGDGSKSHSADRHSGDGVMTMNELWGLIDEVNAVGNGTVVFRNLCPFSWPER